MADESIRHRLMRYGVGGLVGGPGGVLGMAANDFIRGRINSKQNDITNFAKPDVSRLTQGTPQYDDYGRIIGYTPSQPSIPNSNPSLPNLTPAAISAPVDTSGLYHPAVPNMVPTVTGPDGKPAPKPTASTQLTQWLMDSTGRYNSPNGPTYSANEDEQKKYGYWGAAAYQNTGSANPFWGGQGGGGTPGGGSSMGWNIPGFASAPTTYATGGHGVK